MKKLRFNSKKLNSLIRSLLIFICVIGASSFINSCTNDQNQTVVDDSIVEQDSLTTDTIIHDEIEEVDTLLDEVNQPEVIEVREETLDDYLVNIEVPEEIKENLKLVELNYLGFDSVIHTGKLVIHKELVEEVQTIFNEILLDSFPIEKMIPMHLYNWSDDSSMADNNCSAFNFRITKATQNYSYHSFGTAIDINPAINPYVYKGNSQPEGAVYDPERPGTLTLPSVPVQAFLRQGWHWGGYWRSSKDYQHFQKDIDLYKLYQKDTVYTVQKGEVWSVLIEKFGVSQKYIEMNNPDSVFFVDRRGGLHPLRNKTLKIPLQVSNKKEFNPYTYYKL